MNVVWPKRLAFASMGAAMICVGNASGAGKLATLASL
jgi:hypothetical protein